MQNKSFNKFKGTKLLLIGYGNMGRAIVKALEGDFEKNELVVLEKNTIQSNFASIKTTEELPTNFIPDLVIIAVKPQDFYNLAQTFAYLNERVNNHTIFVSIMAGVSLKKLEEVIGKKVIIRTMPNLNILINQSLSAYIANKYAENYHIELFEYYFKKFSSLYKVEKEDDINKFTALSGSGPAYLFYFFEALEEAMEGAMDDFPYETKQIIYQTLQGSLNLLKENNLDAKQLRKQVTSKGGTTESAINHLEKHHFKKIVAEAIELAYKKAKELNQ
ncbi:MAG: pyrroline-5-carboxylate reductase [Alphaproteobacteria bacterium]|jgi:pyrroline-5-carboxylate reductase